MREATSRAETLRRLDSLLGDMPYTHTPACHLLFDLASARDAPQLVEIACGYGKATAYLGAAARRRGGSVLACDGQRPVWEERTPHDVVAAAGAADHCRIDLEVDARWWLLDLLTERPDQWIDLAYVDAAHTVEVDSFLVSALWRHIRPGGVLVLDDLDWTASLHARPGAVFSRPDRSHVRALYDYLRALPDVADATEWGREEVGWTWALLLKASGSGPADLASLLR